MIKIIKQYMWHYWWWYTDLALCGWAWVYVCVCMCMVLSWPWVGICLYESRNWDIVTLCRWPAKQTIPLSVLARNQTKGFGLEILVWPEEVTGREKRVGWRKELTRVGDRTRIDAVDSGHSSREDRVQRRR